MKKNGVRGKCIRIYNSVDSGERYNFIFFGSSVVVPLCFIPYAPWHTQKSIDCFLLLRLLGLGLE